MRFRTQPQPLTGSRGFSMLELLIVVGLIVVIAAIALPNVAGYVRNAKVRGATQQVAGEIQVARNKAIVKNVNPGRFGGVAFAILDSNSYRFTVFDDNFPPLPTPPDATLTTGLAPIRDLPQGVTFVPAATAPTFGGIGFNALGQRCPIDEDQPPCTAQVAIDTICADGDSRCNDRPGGIFIESLPTPNASTLQIRVREDATGIVRWIRIEPGGRVTAQR
jgi:prepilin-type N-terminal cleavage/methylation domain-containing protein